MNADTTTLFIGTGFVLLGCFIWFYLTYFAMGMARKRGRRPGVWAALTFVTFGIALLVLAILPIDESSSKHKKSHLQ
jgi:threonine/homoserine/homoserine lactone efflux protein